MWPFTTQSTAYTSDDVVESGAPVSAFENRAGQSKASADGMGAGSITAAVLHAKRTLPWRSTKQRSRAKTETPHAHDECAPSLPDREEKKYKNKINSVKEDSHL